MSSKPSVRVRFAPSPTGALHIGGLRSALFNWLWAKHNQGKFVLRIEDTDRARFVEGTEDQIMDSLTSLGLAPDESPLAGGPFAPYRQSERLGIYADHASQLQASGALYPCWCEPERLDLLRAAARDAGKPFKYDRHCLAVSNHKSLNDPHVLRFRIPDAPERIGWDDAVRGHLEVRTEDLDDFVAIKADGFPTYQFANVIDDHLMEISHVLRADEWIPSTPKHLLLFRALKWSPPVYAHLPAVQGPTGGKKLSKRDGAKSVQEYLVEGYLPEALVSFLATLGWNDGTTQEVYTPDELIAKFSLDRVQKSPARFDAGRLTWINGYLIRQLAPQELLERSRPFWPKAAAHATDAYLGQILGLVQERLKFFGELPLLTDFFFTDPLADVDLLTHSLDLDTSRTALDAVIQALDAISDTDWNHDTLEHTIRDIQAGLGLSSGKLFGVIRLAVTGHTASPGLFETLAVLGPERSKRRLRTARTSLSR